MKRSLLRQPASTATPPELGRQIKARIAGRLSEMRVNAYWVCHDCGGINTREEGEQGQPHYCGTCHSHRIELNPRYE